MTKNREIAEFILGKMKEYGYEPYDIEYGNGYFLFDMGGDSVVHFRCKGVWKHWKFGMWVQSGLLEASEEDKKKYKLISVFAQYDTCINKFKPTASEVVVEFNANEWDETRENNGLWLWDLEHMLNMMRRHPFMCYAGFCGEDKGYYDGSFIWSFLKYESFFLKQMIIKKVQTAFWLPYTKAKIFLAKHNKYVKNIELYDFEKENPGWSTDYLYQVRVTFTADSTDENEVKWLDKWFKKDKYGKFDTYDHVVELGDLHREGKKKAYSYAWSE